MPGRNSQVARIYTILGLLENAPQGLTVAELASRTNARGHQVAKRTVYRDLEALNAAGFPLFPTQEDDHRGSRWVLGKNTRISQHLVLSVRELVALFLARGMLSPFKHTPFFKDLCSVFIKLEEKISERHREYFKSLSSEYKFLDMPKVGIGISEVILEAVSAGCSERQILEVVYKSAHSQTERIRKVGPHYVYFAKGSLYLVAEDLEDRVVKTFSLPRISRANVLEEQYKGRPVEPENLFAHSIGVFRGEKPISVRIRCKSSLESYLVERKWHASQVLEHTKEGLLILEMTVAMTPELVQWILGFGASMQVLAPIKLRAQIREAASQIMKLYKSAA